MNMAPHTESPALAPAPQGAHRKQLALNSVIFIGAPTQGPSINHCAGRLIINKRTGYETYDFWRSAGRDHHGVYPVATRRLCASRSGSKCPCRNTGRSHHHSRDQHRFRHAGDRHRAGATAGNHLRAGRHALGDRTRGQAGVAGRSHRRQPVSRAGARRGVSKRGPGWPAGAGAASAATHRHR